MSAVAEARVARHEAGHLVVARRLGATAHARLALAEEAPLLGRTTYAGLQPDEDLIVLVSGAVAECNAWHPVLRKRLPDVAASFLTDTRPDAVKVRAILDDLEIPEHDDSRLLALEAAVERAADLLEEIGADRINAAEWSIERGELAESEPVDVPHAWNVWTDSRGERHQEGVNFDGSRWYSKTEREHLLRLTGRLPEPEPEPVAAPLADEGRPDLELEIVRGAKASALLRAARDAMRRKPKQGTFVGVQPDGRAHVVSTEPMVRGYLNGLPTTADDDDEWARQHEGTTDGWYVSKGALAKLEEIVKNKVDDVAQVRR